MLVIHNNLIYFFILFWIKRDYAPKSSNMLIILKRETPNYKLRIKDNLFAIVFVIFLSLIRFLFFENSAVFRFDSTLPDPFAIGMLFILAAASYLYPVFFPDHYPYLLFFLLSLSFIFLPIAYLFAFFISHC